MLANCCEYETGPMVCGYRDRGRLVVSPEIQKLVTFKNT